MDVTAKRKLVWETMVHFYSINNEPIKLLDADGTFWSYQFNYATGMLCMEDNQGNVVNVYPYVG